MQSSLAPNSLVQTESGSSIPTAAISVQFVEPTFQSFVNLQTITETYDFAERIGQHLAHRIARQPGHIQAHVQRIALHVKRKESDAVHGALLDLYIVLGAKGTQLRERMLKLAEPLLNREALAFFVANTEAGVTTEDVMPASACSVLTKSLSGTTELVKQIGNTQNLDRDPLLDARDCLEEAGSKRTPPSTHRAAMYLDERSANAYIGSAPDIDVENQQQIVDAQYDPDKFFQGYLKRAYSTAKSKACSVLVHCTQGSISISPTTGTVLNISEQKLRSLSTVPIIEGTLSVSLSDKDERVVKNGNDCLVDSESLMWKTALWASRGRVPAGTSFTTPVMMRRWPNLTRLMVFPHAMRIAALWADATYPLVDTAKYLDIPQRNVFAFYSAAHAIGLVNMAESDTASPIEPKASMAEDRKGLLNRIISRLQW